MGQEIFPVMWGGAGMGQEKSMRGGGEDPILRPRPALFPSDIVFWVNFKKIKNRRSAYVVLKKKEVTSTKKGCRSAKSSLVIY